MIHLLIIFGSLIFSSVTTNSFIDSEIITKANDQPRRIFDSYFVLTDLEPVPDVCKEYYDEACAKQWLDEFDRISKRNNNRLTNVRYKYSTNMNQDNEKLAMKFQMQGVAFNKEAKWKAKRFQWQKFRSSQLKRLLFLLNLTVQSANETISTRLLEIHNKIANVYSNANPCFIDCLGSGEPGIVNLFEKERDYDKLLGYWSAWREVTGKGIKDLFLERIKLENIAIQENGYFDAASFQLKKEFEESNFNETIIRLYTEILPLYKQLHAYVRYCLSSFYPRKFNSSGPIPAHILGNAWAQQWNNILPLIRECRQNKHRKDIQAEVDKKLRHVSVRDMFTMSDGFFTSLGMDPMTNEFWERSIVEQRQGKLMDCHASAHDFSNGKDFRIKMCTQKSFNDVTTIHHEMGHIEYFMAYRNEPFIFQDAPNPGFHEAIGDTMALSVKTTAHLRNIGLLNEVHSTNEFDIDYLLSVALEKIVFLPFALTMASYVWGVCNGSVSHDRLNEHWWDLHYIYQGISPPIKRTESDFDPGSKYHVAMGISYIKYFTSFIYQFQFLEAMCRMSNSTVLLHQCDFYGSKNAGRRLWNMMEKGKKQHWRNSLDYLTGNRDISSKSLLAYFEPLFQWLRKTNKDLGLPIGW